MREGYRPYKYGFLRPDTHEPGKQSGFQMGKGKKFIGSEHASGPHKNVVYWPLGMGASDQMTKEQKEAAKRF